jgi:hypothetical protein
MLTPTRTRTRAGAGYYRAETGYDPSRAGETRTCVENSLADKIKSVPGFR